MSPFWSWLALAGLGGAAICASTYRHAETHPVGHGGHQTAGEFVPFRIGDALADRPEFALEPDPFQVDHVVGKGGFQPAHSGDCAAEVGGHFHEPIVGPATEND